MKHITQFTSKKVLVLGLAKSGVAAAELLHKLGAFVTVNDAKPFEESPDAQNLLSKGITVICGRHPEDLLDEGFEYVIKNPGIPYRNPIISDAISRGIPVWTEIELAYLISEAPFIGITGSNGKTTTTTLLFHMLNQGGQKPLIAGNIGTVACSVAQEAQEDQVIVTELSSFQLMGIDQFKPKISILTNLYEAHLDYHGSFEEYGDAKFAVTKNQKSEDIFIYNADQPAVVQYANKTNAKLLPFSTKGRKQEGISADAERIYWLGEPYLERKSIALPGEHNLENILAAVATSILMSCPKETIEHVLTSFTGVKHRTQFVREWKQRKFFNDSKATNTLATKSALAAFNEPIILIAGGLDRGHSFEEMRDYMGNVKAIVSFGETADRLIEFAKSCGVEGLEKVENIQQAVKIATKFSQPHDVILLSPACASWDQYANFELRGDDFIEAVFQIN
ncbi:UDP-N-acetylmuramoyl-L-alanine--D-glutamate ligase [Paenisporosarcina quisquiliarum]|uniref:UDP-N-acetylmuramoylalanine--D-glutamate ligase n=1 Tax=Paenisporosarcina quisquiliarum TaxID=365346 RepID=A0A9X3LFE7_9BACL|nr:UDP-N-acetylmuramoyl-L-alanine--D-glutamate ligase [Paenisporosarcina quisquiliarum]MCZ8536395.1 UDP-N-acetylmuramoyl-L-alanine--D-glutamate ligase [Paenisporosarcina quisquiliarum]